MPQKPARQGIIAEKGMGCESPAIPVGVCVEVFMLVGKMPAIGKLRRQSIKMGGFLCLI